MVVLLNLGNIWSKAILYGWLFNFSFYILPTLRPLFTSAEFLLLVKRWTRQKKLSRWLATGNFHNNWSGSLSPLSVGTDYDIDHKDIGQRVGCNGTARNLAFVPSRVAVMGSPGMRMVSDPASLGLWFQYWKELCEDRVERIMTSVLLLWVCEENFPHSSGRNHREESQPTVWKDECERGRLCFVSLNAPTPLQHSLS
jgi:hypothetical protein